MTHDNGDTKVARVTRVIVAQAHKATGVEIVSYVVAAFAMWLAIELKLLGALLTGMAVFQVIHALAPLLERRVSSARARWFAVMILSVFIVGSLSALTVGVVHHFRTDAMSLQKLLDKLMVIVDKSRSSLPAWIQRDLPGGTREMRDQAVGWLRAHIGDVQQGSRDAVRGLAHVTIGLIFGGIVAVSATRHAHHRPLAAALLARATHFSDAFRRIVFAQVKISAINTTFTAIFLLAALPLFHTHLPLGKTLVLISFVVGLIPVIGNLISNALILTVSLSVGLPVAVASLVFLVVIHKFEYFLNARIVGGEIEARSWELLLAMLVMEAAFGMPGLLAAPVYYAYVKRELIIARLV